MGKVDVAAIRSIFANELEMAGELHLAQSVRTGDNSNVLGVAFRAMQRVAALAEKPDMPSLQGFLRETPEKYPADR